MANCGAKCNVVNAANVSNTRVLVYISNVNAMRLLPPFAAISFLYLLLCPVVRNRIQELHSLVKHKESKLWSYKHTYMCNCGFGNNFETLPRKPKFSLITKCYNIYYCLFQDIYIETGVQKGNRDIKAYRLCMKLMYFLNIFS